MCHCAANPQSLNWSTVLVYTHQTVLFHFPAREYRWSYHLASTTFFLQSMHLHLVTRQWQYNCVHTIHPVFPDSPQLHLYQYGKGAVYYFHGTDKRSRLFSYWPQNLLPVIPLFYLWLRYPYEQRLLDVYRKLLLPHPWSNQFHDWFSRKPESNLHTAWPSPNQSVSVLHSAHRATSKRRLHLHLSLHSCQHRGRATSACYHHRVVLPDSRFSAQHALQGQRNQRYKSFCFHHI